MFVKSSSTGKAKVKHSRLRMTECSTCPKVMHKNTPKKDYERPQPIKIGKLLRQAENIRNVQKDSARKKIQPERLGPSSTVKSTKKDSKQNGIGTCDGTVNVMKCVRRNLNFNEFPVKSSQNNHENKTQPNKLTLDESISKKCSDSIIKKRSLLLPSNTIKGKHLQKCTDKVNRYSKIPVIPNKIPLINKENIIRKEQRKTETVNILQLNKESHKINNSTMRFGSIKPLSENKIIKSSGHLNSMSTDTSHLQCLETSHIVPKVKISPRPTNQEITMNNENQLLVQNNPPQERCTSNEIDLITEQFTKSEEGECIQGLHSILQDTKLVDSENNMICINRDKIMSLECGLKNLLSVTEENVLKLKSMLMCITKLLSGNDEKITLSNADVKKNHIELEKSPKEVQVDTYNLIEQQLEENVRTPIAHTSRINVTNVLSLNTNQNVESDKKNYELINVKRMSNGDGSFLELEKQLNIIYTKPTKDSISLQKTPIVKRYKQKRSFREYMALKSTMKFLETPDGKKLKPLCQIDNIDNSILNATYISNKLLTDLSNLYSESPES
ncbi:uncharacterized protein LOC117609979 isoform X1 [Osmia lignaria lignaria]|uniref:uncharacterized protein LOC117609979 isoform X1 n=1 Tax=Osmia lignaria lignaria TaxID=1437193 RepID=UPI00402B9A6E